MKNIFKCFDKKKENAEYLKQLRKELVIEIIRKRSSDALSGNGLIYKLPVAQEAEILLLYITGKISIDANKLIEYCNNK